MTRRRCKIGVKGGGRVQWKRAARVERQRAAR
jgi:hypothetical protein